MWKENTPAGRLLIGHQKFGYGLPKYLRLVLHERTHIYGVCMNYEMKVGKFLSGEDSLGKEYLILRLLAVSSYAHVSVWSPTGESRIRIRWKDMV